MARVTPSWVRRASPKLPRRKWSHASGLVVACVASAVRSCGGGTPARLVAISDARPSPRYAYAESRATLLNSSTATLLALAWTDAGRPAHGGGVPSGHWKTRNARRWVTITNAKYGVAATDSRYL